MMRTAEERLADFLSTAFPTQECAFRPDVRRPASERSKDPDCRPLPAADYVRGSNRSAMAWAEHWEVARRIGAVTEPDDDFLAKPEPFAEPRGGGL